MMGRGPWQRYVGAPEQPDAGRAVAAALVAGALLGAFTVAAPLPERALLAVLTADVCGGLVAHLFRGRGAPAGEAPRWVLGQWLQFVVFAWFFREGDPLRIALVGAVHGIALVLLPRLPPSLQRRAGLAVVGVALLAVDATLGLLPEAGWYLPLLLTKVCVAYLPASGAPAPSTAGDD